MSWAQYEQYPQLGNLSALEIPIASYRVTHGADLVSVCV